MLVSETSRRSNLRVLYGILAQSALEKVSTPEPDDAERDVYFRNFVRLLEMYRRHALDQSSPRAVLDRRASSSHEIRRKRQETDAVESALEQARQTVYGRDASRDAVADQIKSLFANIMKQRPVTREDVQLAKRFLEVFAQSLRA